MIKRLLCLFFFFPVVASATDFYELFKKVDPSVVVLHTYTSSAVTSKEQRGLGSGVVISDDGKILTAAHVVHSTDSIDVEFRTGERYLAHVIGTEPSADLALLQLDKFPKDLNIAQLGDSKQVNVGNEIFIIGSPYGLHHTLTTGHISAKHSGQSLGKMFIDGDFFQTDAAINKGNSGGPVFNLNGKVIGIVSHIKSNSGGNEGLGFIVTSNTARRLMLDRKNYWTGLNGILITPTIAKAINYPLEEGVLIQTIAYGSVADKFGLKEGYIPAKIGKDDFLLGGDIIVNIVDIPFTGRESLKLIRERIEKMNSGELIELNIYREGKFTTLSLKKP